MYRAGELFRRRDRPDDAVRCLEHALRISDTHLPALDALEQVWRERGDLERVSVILGRKVAATARHPHRQKPLLSRLGDLQHQLGRPDVADWRVEVRRAVPEQLLVHLVPAAGREAADVAVSVARDVRAAAGLLPSQVVLGPAGGLPTGPGPSRRLLDQG